MQTRPPSITRILIAVGFALSCFGLALFLWIAFGGPVPLKPEGYRFTVPFDEATQLAVESDVRISGVSVGKVKGIELSDDGKAVATVELEERYAPVPEDTRAMLRQKTLLGETYIELTPGSDDSGFVPEDGSLPEGQVAQSVQLDEIFRTFDEPTRVAFQQWMQNQAIAFAGRGTDLSAAIAELDPFAQEVTDTLRILDTQRLAVRQLFREGGEVFAALSERPGQLRGLIENSNTVFQTTARRNLDLQETFRVFPTFLDESRLTLTRLEEFAANADPLVKQLRPAVRELGPTAVDLARLAPHLQRLWVGLRRSIDSRAGLRDLARLLRSDLPPVLERLPGYLNELDPIFRLLRRYERELAAFVANSAAATQYDLAPRVLRTVPPLNPESVASFPDWRLASNRTNPYVKPGGYLRLRRGGALRSFETRHCESGGSGLTAELSPDVIDNPAFRARARDQDVPPDGIDDADVENLYTRILQYVFAIPDASPTDSATTARPDFPQPACREQAPLRSIGKTMPEFTKYLHVYRQGTP
jgi:phospholipid/cholesterol/gamma-HCH transport system substrate-binding protein